MSSWCVTMQCDMSQLTSRYNQCHDTLQWCPNKNIDFPQVFQLFYCNARTSWHIVNQFRAITTSWLRRDCIVITAMRHDKILTSQCVATCVVIQKKLKKPNLIIINRVFSWFYKVLYVFYAEFWAWISRDIYVKQFCLDWKIFKKYMFRTRCRTEYAK